MSSLGDEAGCHNTGLFSLRAGSPQGVLPSQQHSHQRRIHRHGPTGDIVTSNSQRRVTLLSLTHPRPRRTAIVAVDDVTHGRHAPRPWGEEMGKPRAARR